MVSNSLFETFRSQLKKLNVQSYCIAYSGGLDSQVLLHLFASLRQEFHLSLKVVHVHHGLSPNADAWVVHCQQQCARLGLPLIVEYVNLINMKEDGLEEAARKARYQSLAKHLLADDVLVTAHHQDDQAETLLLQLLRGAGVKGLSAMPELKPFAQGQHYRPLLAFPREDLLQYADSHQLSWVEDESNAHADFARNYLRHEVMPLLQNRWPAMSNSLSRSAKHCAESQQLLDEYAALLLQPLLDVTGLRLVVDSLKLLSGAQQRLVLRYWIASKGFQLPDQKKLNVILSDVLLAAQDRNPCLQGEGWMLRRYRGELYLDELSVHLADVAKTQPLWQRLDENHWQCRLVCGRVLRASQLAGKGIVFSPEQLSILYRQGGERLKTQSGLRRKLKHLMQEWAVPTWQRSILPLLHYQECLVAVVGYGEDVDYQVAAGEFGWVYDLVPHHD